MTKEKVVFRKFEDGDIIALFPEMKNGPWIGSYMYAGQHSDASPELIKELDKATPEEYAPLLSELRSIGYKLEIID
jgi:hypothetical protein